jgi:hypothetical protein
MLSGRTEDEDCIDLQVESWGCLGFILKVGLAGWLGAEFSIIRVLQAQININAIAWIINHEEHYLFTASEESGFPFLRGDFPF